MLKRTVLAVVAGVLLTTPLKAKDCPVETRVEGTLDAQEEAIRKAPTCKAAYEIMEACAYGASGDTGLGEAVRERCEPEFIGKLSRAQRRAYDGKVKACDRKYIKQSGTMYRSFEAFCRAGVTRDTAAKFATAKK